MAHKLKHAVSIAKDTARDAEKAIAQARRRRRRTPRAPSRGRRRPRRETRRPRRRRRRTPRSYRTRWSANDARRRRTNPNSRTRRPKAGSREEAKRAKPRSPTRAHSPRLTTPWRRLRCRGRRRNTGGEGSADEPRARVGIRVAARRAITKRVVAESEPTKQALGVSEHTAEQIRVENLGLAAGLKQAEDACRVFERQAAEARAALAAAEKDFAKQLEANRRARGSRRRRGSISDWIPSRDRAWTDLRRPRGGKRREEENRDREEIDDESLFEGRNSRRRRCGPRG